MTNIISLQAELREKAGKGAARADRKLGRVPAVVYGNKQTPVAFTLCANEILRLLNKGGFKASEFHIAIGNEVHKAKFQSMQLHPVRHQPIHIDFLRVA
jgi:large subunit ribosomal protein L25